MLRSRRALRERRVAPPPADPASSPRRRQYGRGRGGGGPDDACQPSSGRGCERAHLNRRIRRAPCHRGQRPYAVHANRTLDPQASCNAALSSPIAARTCSAVEDQRPVAHGREHRVPRDRKSMNSTPRSGRSHGGRCSPPALRRAPASWRAAVQRRRRRRAGPSSTIAGNGEVEQAPDAADPPPSYQAYTEAMNELATTIAGWRKVT